MKNFDKTKAERFRFLNHLYEVSGGNTDEIFDMDELGNKLGLGKDETDKIEKYLEENGLIASLELGGGIGITHYGVVQVEKAISHPESHTQNCPTINFIQIESMSNSQIQQATNSSIQTSTISFAYDKTQVENLLSEIKTVLKSMNVDHQTQKDLNGKIATIEGQLITSNPKKSITIIKESLKTVRTILEQTGASLLAAKIASILNTFG